MFCDENFQKCHVSIIVPVFNGEVFITRCLKSVLSQTLKNLDIICVDDGSTDRSLSIAKNFAKNDHRVNVVHQERCGVSCARNTGISQAKGEYITFVDSDDWIEPNLCEIAHSKAKEFDADVVIWGSLFNNKWYFGPKKDNVLQGSHLAKTFFGGKTKDILVVVWNKLYKRSLLTKMNVSFEIGRSFAEDLQFNLKLKPAVTSIVWIKKVLYHYRHFHYLPTNTKRRHPRQRDNNTRWRHDKNVRGKKRGFFYRSGLK